MTNSHKDTTLTSTQNWYALISHWGIGDELWEDSQREKPKHNLSGSCHELQIQVSGQVLRILVDIWWYQWRGKLEREIKEIAKWVAAIILTHPHMDHIGDFPRLFSEWSEFPGRVFTTPGTLQATQIALIDAAKILQREYEKKYAGWQKTTEEVASAFYTLRNNDLSGEKRVARTAKGDRLSQTGVIVDKKESIEDSRALLEKNGFTHEMKDTWRAEMKKREPEKPAYTIEDVYTSLWSIETYGIKDGWKELVPWQVAFRFYNAGHIIGSVSVLFRITNEKKSKYVLFSWDLGSYKWDMHPTGVPTPPHNLPIDTVMIESTYGAKVREDFAIGLADFEMTLKRDLLKYRRVTISTFAMDRTQNILARLIKMKLAWEIDADIVLDSPAGIQHTQAYVQATKNIDELIVRPKAASIQALLGDNFEERERGLLEEFREYIDPRNGHYTIADKDNRESLFAARESGRKMIVLTSSGMADWGMVIQHLQSNIEDPTTVFYFPGYLVPGTLGYAIANKDQPWGQQKRITIEGKLFEVKARMKQFNFLSGHGDAEDLRAWLRALKLPKGATIRIVHGDVSGSSLEFAHSLERDGWFHNANIIVPNLWDKHFFPLDNTEWGKWEKKRKSWFWPLVIEAGPARRRLQVPQNQKAGRVRKKEVDLGHDSGWIAPPKEQARTSIKVGARLTAERRRYAEIVHNAHSIYDDFYRELESMPIPYLQSILRYYRDRSILTLIQEQGNSLRYSMSMARKQLQEIEDPPEKKKWQYLGDPSVIRMQIASLEGDIARNSEALIHRENTMRWNPIQAKVAAYSLSRWIIESLWYTVEQIPPHSQVIPIEDEDSLKRVVVETLMEILKYDPETTGHAYELLTQMVVVMKAKPLSSWDYEAHDKTVMEAFARIKSRYSLDTSIVLLIGKINPDYTFQVTKKQSVPLWRKSPVKKIWPENIVISSKKIWTSRDTLSAEIIKLETKRKKYKQYHLQRKDGILKDQNRLQELKQIHESRNMPSRGKFKNLSPEEIEKKLIVNTQELKSVNASLRNSNLIDEPHEYEILMKEMTRLTDRLSRLK